MDKRIGRIEKEIVDWLTTVKQIKANRVKFYVMYLCRHGLKFDGGEIVKRC